MNNNLNHVNALPYIGKSYFSPATSPKILILGHNHYCANPNKEFVPDITRGVIGDYLEERRLGRDISGEYRSYIYFEQAVIGDDASPAQALDFWASVALYNYVQSPMTPEHKTRKPTKKQYLESWDAFFEVLEYLRPDYVIAWGITNYKNLPTSHNCKDINPSGMYICTYDLADGTCVPVLGIHHPSMRFNREEWRPIIKQFLSGEWKTGRP